MSISEALSHVDPNRRLAGKVAVVTAAGGGIGGATALRLARDAARVVVCLDRNARVLEMPDHLRAFGAEALALQLACHDEPSVVKAFGEIERR